MKKTKSASLCLYVAAFLVATALTAGRAQAAGPVAKTGSESLLSKVKVCSVYQNTTNPSSNLSVTVIFTNGNATPLSGITVSLKEMPDQVLSLVSAIAPVSIGAGSSAGIGLSLAPSANILDGYYPLDLLLTYMDNNGVTVMAEKRIPILIDRTPSLPENQKTGGNPRIILDSYDIGADQVYSGEEFDLTYTLINMSGAAVNNMLLTLSSDSNAFIPTTGMSSQFFIDGIGPGGCYTGKIPPRRQYSAEKRYV